MIDAQISQYEAVIEAPTATWHEPGETKPVEYASACYDPIYTITEMK